jgi:enoyl-CoA hydratase/carnithine racemase
MEMILTGLPMGAEEAMQRGLVSKVFPVDQLVDAAIKTADVIASHSKMAVRMAKESTNAAYESREEEEIDKFKMARFALTGSIIKLRHKGAGSESWWMDE